MRWPVILGSVSAKHSLYLKDMAFKSKATENKLLLMSALGPKFFSKKFSSAENLRNAKETQHVRSNFL